MLQLVENLNQKMFPSHNHIGVEADWDRMGIMSHSLGAMFITEMLQTNSTFAKAVIATEMKLYYT